MTSTAAVAVTVAARLQLHLPSTPSFLLDMSVARAHTPIKKKKQTNKKQEWVLNTEPISRVLLWQVTHALGIDNKAQAGDWGL